MEQETAIQLTRWVLALAVLILALYDIAIFSLAGREATFSCVLRDLARSHPTVPFVFGYLAGHLWWSLK